MVITSGKLRMSDDERLQAIDKIYLTVEDQYSFLKDFPIIQACFRCKENQSRCRLKCHGDFTD